MSKFASGKSMNEQMSRANRRRSCFWAALQDARKCTKRDKKTGCWLGAIGYMALLDQISSSLKPKGEKTTGGEQDPLIKLPGVPWNGDYKSVGRENKTVVNLELFGDLESIYQGLCAKARRGELEIALSGGVDELRVRYFITIT